jgi:diguanylate cyclase (GGDEF)-like protein/PAS domain S-box-containing protein
MIFFKKQIGSYEKHYQSNRLKSLGLLLAVIILAALFQYVQLRQERISQLVKELDAASKRLESIISYESNGLITLADTHILLISNGGHERLSPDPTNFFETSDPVQEFTINRVNPYVSYDQMGIIFGVNPKRFSEPAYGQELDAVFISMERLKVLKEFTPSVIQTYYYSYKGVVGLQPWADILDLKNANGLSNNRALMNGFEAFINPGEERNRFHAIDKNIVNHRPVLVVTVPVSKDELDWGHYGAVIDLEKLKEEILFNQDQIADLSLFAGNEIMVQWKKDGSIALPKGLFFELDSAENGMTTQKEKGTDFDFVFFESNQKYGLGYNVSEMRLLLSLLPQMWVYSVLILSLIIFFVSFEMMMMKRYYKPALILSRILNGSIEDKSVLESKQSSLWSPIYKRIKEYIDLVSITNALPGAILQVVKSGDKYVIKYYTKGLNRLLKQDTRYPIPTGTDFLGIFDSNSYWNLKNLLRDSEAYMIPIEYEAGLNSESEDKVYVNIVLKPSLAMDKSVFWEGMIIDVTDRQVLEQELSEEKRFIEKLFNLSGALFAVLDKDLNIVRCNQTFMQQFPIQVEDQSQSLKIEKLFAPFDFINFKEQFLQVLQGTATGMFEHYWLLPDGRKKLVKTTIAPMYDMSNQVEFVVLTAIDISDRYKIEEELKKTNQSLYIKNAQVERSARIQKELFKTFEDLRNVHSIEDIYTTLTKVIGQISNFHNFMLGIKPTKQSSDMQVLDVLGEFSSESYSNYFHYFRGILGRVLLSHIPYITGNILNDPDYIVENPNTRSVIYIPITYNNFLWGILGIDSYVENAFSKMDFEILNVLSSHLGLYMEELHNRTMLKKEADQLRGLHHVIQDISSLRNNDEIAQRIVENGLLKHLAIFKTMDNGDYEMIAESVPTSYTLFGIMPNYAILDHSLSKNKMINGRIGALNVFHLANPVCVDGKVAGLLYSIKDHEFSVKDEELILIISEQMAVFWRLNDMIERANKEALIDPLTGIWNRRYMIDRLNQENYRTIRYNNPATVAIIDLGDFKAINDSFGHNTGDMVLQEVAADFSQLIRESDFVGRYGGDEFIVFMPNTNYEQGLALLGRIATTVESKRYSQNLLHLFIDFGLATVPEDNQDLFEAVKIADERMYHLKNSRKARAIEQ